MLEFFQQLPVQARFGMNKKKNVLLHWLILQHVFCSNLFFPAGALLATTFVFGLVLVRVFLKPKKPMLTKKEVRSAETVPLI